MLSASGLAWQRRSHLDLRPADPRARILLVDKVGELAAWWGTAQIAYVGGSMGKRNGQNMIEPAAYGAAIIRPTPMNLRRGRLDSVSQLLRGIRLLSSGSAGPGIRADGRRGGDGGRTRPPL